MDGWTIGLIALVVIGLAAIVYGALSDRAKTRRAIAEMTSPPPRTIPHFRPDAPAAQYLSELQARRPPAGANDLALSDPDRQQLKAQLDSPATVRVPVGFSSPEFVTDQALGWVVLDEPRVLVCAEPVETVRELLGVLEELMRTRTPLVVVAPRLAPDVAQTLIVNHIQRTMRIVALTPPEPVLYELAKITGATPIDRSDLQAGYLPSAHLGRCRRLVATKQQTSLISPPKAI